MSSRWIADPSRQLTSARLCRASILRHRRVPRVMAPPVAIESHRHREGRHLGRRCRQPLADPSHAATSASGNDIPDNTDSLVFPGFAYRPSATVRRLSNPAFLHAIVRQYIHAQPRFGAHQIAERRSRPATGHWLRHISDGAMCRTYAIAVVPVTPTRSYQAAST